MDENETAYTLPESLINSLVIPIFTFAINDKIHRKTTNYFKTKNIENFLKKIKDFRTLGRIMYYDKSREKELIKK
jgi:hypothetical protein